MQRPGRYSLLRLLLIWPSLLLRAGQIGQPEDLTPTLIARYDLHEGAGHIVRDESGNGHDCTIYGATWEKVEVGYALRFDGQDDYMDCGRHNAFDWTGPITLEIWIRPDELPVGEALLIGKGLGTYALTYSGGEYPARVFWHIGPAKKKARARAVATLWHHVVATFDGTRLRIWIDATVAGGVRVWRQPAAEPGDRLLVAGGFPSLAHFKGLVRGIRVYRGVVSGAQVLERYQRDKPRYLDQPAALRPLGGRGVKVLNNLVAELLNLKDLRARSEREFSFTNPRSPTGWVFLSTTARVRGNGRVFVTVDRAHGGELVIAHDTTRHATQEAMRLLPAVRHTLRIRSEGSAVIESVVVRSIPDLLFGPYPVKPAVAAFDPYWSESVEKEVLRNTTTLVGPPDGETAGETWRREGKRLVTEDSAPWFDRAAKRPNETADQFYLALTSKSGMQRTLSDGLLLDTHDVGHNTRYEPYATAIRRLCRERAWKAKTLYLYCDSLYGAPSSERFARAVLECGYTLVWTRYLHEQPTERAAWSFIEAALGQEAIAWERALPGFIRQSVVALGYLTSPGEQLNVEPGINYQVFMDMQCNLLANHPPFCGLGGVMWYKARYANEEELRWGARLMRHYFIEGKTSMLSRDPYELQHIQNPDFNKAAIAWDLESAESDSMEVRHVDRYGFLQGRWLETGTGDNFLWSRRSGRRPNVFSQKIRNLQPGRLYSVALYVGDYRKNILERKSTRDEYAVSIQVDNADILADKSFVHLYSSAPYYHLGPYDDEEAKETTWINFHRRVFRARARTARLSISDWAASGDLGGPVGQELMFNFVEIQPYLN